MTTPHQPPHQPPHYQPGPHQYGPLPNYQPPPAPHYPYAPPPGYPAQAVTRVRKTTNHTFHLIMTLLTVGMWGLFVWLPLGLWHRYGPEQRNVTTYQ